MNTPKRVKVTGSRFKPVIPEGSVWIGRAAPYRKASPFANPFTVAEYGRACAVQLYREYLDAHPELVERARRELAGRDVACVCDLDQECHGDPLLAAIASLVALTAEALLAA